MYVYCYSRYAMLCIYMHVCMYIQPIFCRVVVAIVSLYTLTILCSYFVCSNQTFYSTYIYRARGIGPFRLQLEIFIRP